MSMRTIQSIVEGIFLGLRARAMNRIEDVFATPRSDDGCAQTSRACVVAPGRMTR
jgi:hypothetical protein